MSVRSRVLAVVIEAGMVPVGIRESTETRPCGSLHGRRWVTTRAKGSDKGTGLGLSIVSRLMKNSQGLLWLQSRPNEGTQFKLFFPAAEPES